MQNGLRWQFLPPSLHRTAGVPAGYWYRVNAQKKNIRDGFKVKRQAASARYRTTRYPDQRRVNDLTQRMPAGLAYRLLEVPIRCDNL